MQFTDFSALQNAIRRIGIDKFETQLLEKLQLGELEGDTQNIENIILGGYGIYHLKEGRLAKVILHITDTEKRWIEKNQYAIKAFNAKKYDDIKLIESLHKYHFTKCEALDSMFNSGRKGRYYLAQRMDGTFSYSVIEDNEVIFKNKHQKLNVCKFCLRALIELTNKEYRVQNFKPTDVFATNVVQLSNTEVALECNAVPNIYAKDWHKIANKAKQQADWRCEQCDINLTKDKEYLHCHHIDVNRANNLIANLKVLCIKCHAQKPQHSHINKLPQYKEFLNKYAS